MSPSIWEWNYETPVRVEMKDIQKLLLQAVGERVSQYGFQLKAASQSYVRSFAEGKASLHLAFMSHQHDFDVTADVAVRFDKVEELVNKHNKLLADREKALTHTLGVELGNLAGLGQMRWNVASESDVPEVADKIVAMFVSVGLSYLEKHSSMPSALEILNTPDHRAWLHNPVHEARAKRVLALLWLLGRESELGPALEKNVDFMSSLNDPGLERFRKFADDLRNGKLDEKS